MIQSMLLPPANATFNFFDGPPVLSPDGRRIAFVARSQDGRNRLWARALEEVAAQPLAATEGVTYPFWSADSRSLGFFADVKLKRIDASGGPPQVLCDASAGRGGAWNRRHRLRGTGRHGAVPGLRLRGRLGSGHATRRRDPRDRYQTGNAGKSFQAAWIDRAGKESETGMAAGPIGMLRLSHDGRRVAFRVEDRQARGDLWIHDLARRSRAASPSIPPMISTRSGHPTTRASCSARTEREAGTCTRSRPRGGAEELLFASEYRKSATDWSRYGRLVLFNQFGSTTRQDLWSLSLVDRKATVVLQTEFFESAGALSPDGRWIAYHSDESGRQEVYVQPFRGPGAKWRISREGGISARWRGDGGTVQSFALEELFR